ncbi:MAG: biotin transporter BioY [Synergistaceae bacterium]|jgi:biotin transport system substrate-specific component|nr:biotin transporter BioY [Synergistaceae bacterium]
MSNKTFPLKNLLLTAFFAVLTSIGAMLSVPLPFMPVPITVQSFIVLMSGLLLGPKYGPLSQMLYVVMGLIGLPVFAGGTGGPQTVFSPSFGFLIGFIVASWIGGLLASKAQTFLQYALVSLAATVGLYAVGLPGFYLIMRFAAGKELDFVRVVQLAFLPFLVPDLIKIVVSGWLASRAVPTLEGAGLLSHRPLPAAEENSPV